MKLQIKLKPILLFAIVLVVLTSCTNNNLSPSVSSLSTSISPSATMIYYPLKKYFDLGDQISAMRWEVDIVSDMGNTLNASDITGLGATIDETIASGKFIFVGWTVEYEGKEIVKSFPEPILLDSQNHEYSILPTSKFNNWKLFPSEVMTGGSYYGMPSNLRPGIPVICGAIFDVPLNSSGLKLIIPDLFSKTNQIVLVDLGI